MNDITVGKATICFSERERMWILPGGRYVFYRTRATACAKKLNELMK
ncbi:MAG: hypothetical protein ACPGF7_09465 [Pontibacterium sp.]